MRKPGVAAVLFTLVGLATGAGDTPASIGSESAASGRRTGAGRLRSRPMGPGAGGFRYRDHSVRRRSAVPRYNAAATLFQLGRYAEARQRYLEARERADAFLRTKIDYALGNTALAEGDIPGAIRSYDECVASTAPGAALEAVRRDAAINRKIRARTAAITFRSPRQQLGRPVKVTESGPAEKVLTGKARATVSRPKVRPESDPGSGGASPEAQGDRDRRPSGRRRMGGAGGGRTAPPGSDEETRPTTASTPRSSTSGTPRNRRLPDEDPPVSANDDRKDW